MLLLIAEIKLVKAFAELQKFDIKNKKIGELQYKLILFLSSLQSLMFYYT